MAFARAAAEDCSLLVVDIDHFKAYNDSYGHVEGDACLVAVAECLSAAIDKDRHLVARLGGEEFAVVLNDIGEEAALSTAETMRAGVERLFGPTQNAVRRPVTVSIGLAYRNAAKYKTLAELMDEADIAVYRAKVAGRNRVSPSPQVARQESA
jgi:diguanylate cyclase (GGDEF)-like protein